MLPTMIIKVFLAAGCLAVTVAFDVPRTPTVAPQFSIFQKRCNLVNIKSGLVDHQLFALSRSNLIKPCSGTGWLRFTTYHLMHFDSECDYRLRQGGRYTVLHNHDDTLACVQFLVLELTAQAITKTRNYLVGKKGKKHTQIEFMQKILPQCWRW